MRSGQRRTGIRASFYFRRNRVRAATPFTQSSRALECVDNRRQPKACQRRTSKRALRKSRGMESAVLQQGPGNGPPRQSRPNPQSAWMTADVPELRIIDDEMWRRSDSDVRSALLTGATQRDRGTSFPVHSSAGAADRSYLSHCVPKRYLRSARPAQLVRRALEALAGRFSLG